MRTPPRFSHTSVFERIILTVLAAVLVVLIAAVDYYGARGFILYRSAIREHPIETLEQEIRAAVDYCDVQDLPGIYIDAVICTEDRRFERHIGVDPIAIARALWVDLLTHSFAEGGSTITQQVAKNLLFTQKKTVDRKIAEVFAAFALEHTYSKNQILGMYVNTIYFGQGYYGIAAAAMGYYGKTPAQLTDAEAILLAGIPNAPSAYSLPENSELALQRMDTVLESMVACRRLTAEQAQAIRAEATALVTGTSAAPAGESGGITRLVALRGRPAHSPALLLRRGRLRLRIT